MDPVDEERYEALRWLSLEQQMECDDPDCDLCLPRLVEEPDDG